ncbi:Eco29kI family restriction endonuclease [Nocardia testacea]|uniref:Eco29kI family restriction endonuclease n=1 Tax=Nocardia testacea TaxID=248551 RepID=UPI003A86658E
MTVDDRQTRAPRLMGVAEIAEYARMSRQAISNMRNRDDSFPAPVEELKSGPVFLDSEIRAYFEPRVGSAGQSMTTPESVDRHAPTEFDPLDKANLITSVVDALLSRPALPLDRFESFNGSGLYCLYYSGGDGLYAPIADGDPSLPIYIGTALAHARASGEALSASSSQALARRLRSHAQTIEAVEQHDAAHVKHRLFLRDFSFRCLVVDEMWARPAIDSMLLQSAPAWNSALPGFGNQPPGRSRRAVRKSPWDTLHPGRAWAEQHEVVYRFDELEARVAEHFSREFETRVEP